MNLTKPDFSKISKGGLISLNNNIYDYIAKELKTYIIESYLFGLEIGPNSNYQSIITSLQIGGNKYSDFLYRTGIKNEIQKIAEVSPGFVKIELEDTDYIILHIAL